MTTETPVVLAVDDDEKLLQTYEIWLAADYELRTASDGDSALAQFDSDVDVVLLDRLMPDIAGDDLLEELRDRDVECQVAMVTAVEPEFDIAEMPFDTYVSKAIDEETIRETVDTLAARARRDDVLREHYALAEKLATLDGQKTEAELAASEAYQEMCDRFAALDETLSERSASLDGDDIVSDLAQAERLADLDDAPERSEDTQ